MSLNFALAGSYRSDEESCEIVNLADRYNRVLDIAAQPGFHILTSLLWVRWPRHPTKLARQDELFYTAAATERDFEKPIADATQPDLGLLSFHCDRLATAAEALRWRFIPLLEKSEAGLRALRSSIEMYLRCLPVLTSERSERRKMRLMISRNGILTIDSTVIEWPLTANSYMIDSFLPTTLSLDQLPNKMIASLRKTAEVFIDSRSTNVSPFTTHKTSYRVQYNMARKRMGIVHHAPTEKDVLLYNKNGEIMETSFCSVYFFRNEQWITPAAICGGSIGVTRRLALEKGLCKQGTIEITELIDDELIWLSNGARGFFVGQLNLRDQNVLTGPEDSTSP